MGDSDEDFEEQIRLQKIYEESEKKGHAKTRTDEDGTVFEWDPVKEAWFPKIDADFLAQYQLNYGCNVTSSTSSTTTTATTSNPTTTDYSHFYQWYNQNYQTSSGNTSTETTFDSKEMSDAYNKYLEEYYNKNDNHSGGEANKQEADYHHAHYYKYYTETYLPTANEKDKLSYWEWYAAYVNPGTALNEAKAEDKVKNQQNAKTQKKDDKKPVEESKSEGWFDIDEGKNCTVYVAGLPFDITNDEYETFMKKVGLIQFDPLTNKPKLKLYTDDEGNPKGDGRCCYIKSESVDLALQILDGSDIRGYKISVEKAKFELKGAYDPTKKKRKLTNKEKKKMKLKEEKLLAWQPEKLKGERAKNEKIVILQNVFDPKEFETNPVLIDEIKRDMREECEKFENLQKVVLHDRHPEGVVQVYFKEFESADKCVENLHGRWYASRQLKAEKWDGRTKYTVQETEEERNLRDKKWHEYLLDKEAKEIESKNKAKEALADMTS